jgi:hypothetical protein
MVGKSQIIGRAQVQNRGSVVYLDFGLLRSFNQAFLFVQARASDFVNSALQMILDRAVHDGSFPP